MSVQIGEGTVQQQEVVQEGHHYSNNRSHQDFRTSKDINSNNSRSLMKVHMDIIIGPVHTTNQVMEVRGLVATLHQTVVQPSQGMTLVHPVIGTRMELCCTVIEISPQGSSRREVEDTEIALIRHMIHRPTVAQGGSMMVLEMFRTLAKSRMFH
jgi:hypothetical protein